MNIPASTPQADELIEALEDYALRGGNTGRPDEIAAIAKHMSDAGQAVEACNVLGMVAAVHGNADEVKHQFNEAIRLGGNDAWVLGNYATALNVLADRIRVNRCRDQSESVQGNNIRSGPPLQIDEVASLATNEHRYDCNLFQSILESPSQMGIYVVDCEYRFLAFNDVFHEGAKRLWNKDIAVGMSMLDVIDSDAHREVCRRGFDQVLNGLSFTLETKETVVKDGVSVCEYHDNYGSPIRNDKGEIIGLIIFVTNVTERKQTQRRLELLERAVNLSTDAVFLQNEALEFVYVNETACRSLGYSRDELLGMTSFDIDPDLTQEKCLQIVEEDKVSERHFFETRHKTKDGRIFPVELSGSLFELDGQQFAMSTVRDITERKAMQEMLAARERDFRSLAENSPDNIARWDTGMHYLYINPTHEQLLGVPAREIVGQKLPDSHDQVNAAIAQVIATGQPALGVRQTVLGSNGEMEYHEVSLVPERDGTGQIVSVLGIGRNMTDIYRMQEAIAAREQELRALTDASPGMMGSFYARPDGPVCMPYVSPNIRELFGLDPQDVVDDASLLLSLSHPDDAQRVEESIAESARNMTVWHEEYRIIHPARGERWMESHTKPVPHPNGGVIWYGYIHDITHRKQAEHAFESTRDRLHGVLQTIPDLVWLKDTEGVFLFCNHAFERLFGTKEAEIIGKSDYDFMDAESADFVRKKDREAIAENRICINEEWATFTEDGRRVLLETRKVPLRDSGGQVIGVLGIGQDITERKRAERALEESRTQLRGLVSQREAAREEERRIIAREVHDNLGQILSGLHLNISRFKRRYAANSNEMQQQLRETGELIELAVGEVRNISAALRPVELDMDIGSALASHLERFAAYSGIEYELHVGEDVNTPDDAHSLALFRIAQESLTNVARHAQATKVEVSLVMDAQDYILCIRDNGLGFDTNERQTESFGLVGMRERAAMLGGSVTIDSHPGKGTAITVHMPVESSKERS